MRKFVVACMRYIPSGGANTVRNIASHISMSLLVGIIASTWAIGAAWAQQQGNPQQGNEAPSQTQQLSPQLQSRQVILYRPGDLKGVPYKTLEECKKASESAGNNGVCIIK